MKTIARPVAPKTTIKAPVAPTKPSLPAKPASKAQALAPIMPSRPAKPGAPIVKTPAAPAAPTVDVAALRAELDAAKATIAKLTAKAEKINAKIRTRDQILEGITPDAKDWRTPYQGYDLEILSCTGSPGSYEPEENPSRLSALLAIPRDSDLGGHGSKARLNGLLAVHWERNESGDVCGAPLYVTSDDLARIWAD